MRLFDTALILGGARSGKSAYAERLALEAASAAGWRATYIATAQAWDDEMTARIAEHRAGRGSEWRTVEAPIELSEALRRETTPGHIVLVDCLTLWLSNQMLGDHDLEAASAELLDALNAARSPVIFVSNEVGLGIVPDNALARRFRDAQGRVNQAVAREADLVAFMAAGLPMVLKGETPI